MNKVKIGTTIEVGTTVEVCDSSTIHFGKRGRVYEITQYGMRCSSLREYHIDFGSGIGRYTGDQLCVVPEVEAGRTSVPVESIKIGSTTKVVLEANAKLVLIGEVQHSNQRTLEI